jgi:hypothetical protein
MKQRMQNSGHKQSLTPTYYKGQDETFIINKSGFDSHAANLTTNASLSSGNVYESNKSPYVLNKNKILQRIDYNKGISNIIANDNQSVLSMNNSSTLSRDSGASPSLQTTRTALLKLKDSIQSNEG